MFEVQTLNQTRLMISASTPDLMSDSIPTVRGSEKRRGPALPGLNNIVLPSFC
jgi:hypothetical protein